ncbi:hypothetical protein cand_011110 [Cryptosporidium andersoni]|uniref:Uncharacterized protein n=1 Tax=Cryptosporidium andersoni TaxID=117008 RepID=A0A1J4MQ26_9CRYT|nr:hypothetical protein cand_011110 [Cryptosporidium andersoni]
MKGLDESILNIRSDYLEDCISNNIDKKSGTEISEVVYNDSDPDINIELVHNEEVSNKNTTIISEKLEVKTTKKYKKNLIWDGPRWDLAYFDPTMSKREMKKLRYYEGLFKKIDNSGIKGEVSINYKEKIKGRNSKNKKHILSFLEENLGIEMQNLHENTIKDTKVTDVEDLLLTPSKDKYKQNDLCNSGRYITDKDKVVCESTTKSLSSNDPTIDRDNSSKRRISIDWRMRLLNRTNLTNTISESNN